MNEITKTDEASLTEIADEINTLYGTMENAYMKTASLLARAKEHFNTPKSFMTWATGHTSFAPGTVSGYLAVHKRFSVDSRVKQAKNNIPFKTLRLLASEKVSN